MPSVESVAAPRSSVTAFGRWLMLGVLATGLLLTVRPMRVLLPVHEAAAPLPAATPIARSAKPVAPPSAFQLEMVMSDKQLLGRWEPLVIEASKRFGVPADWIRSVMRRESGGRTMLAEGVPIVSDAGAMGIMQMMPDTYREMARQYGLGADAFAPRDNVLAAAGYLRWLHGKYGYPAMFAAYNDGPGNFEFHAQDGTWPAETKNYVKAIAGQVGLDAILPSAQFQLTRPDGSAVMIEAAKVSAVRAALPGEYAPSVQAVIRMGRVQQGVVEDVATVTECLRKRGVKV